MHVARPSPACLRETPGANPVLPSSLSSLEEFLDVGPLQLVIQDVEVSMPAKLAGDPLCLLDRHHGEARSGRDAPDAELLECCHIGRAGAADDVNRRLDRLS